MDKQKNRATGAGGVVLSDEFLGAMICGFEYPVIMGVDIPETVGSLRVLRKLNALRKMAKGRPVRVVPE